MQRNPQCSICLDEINNPCVTPCGHMYCYECICEWLEQSNQCPICKSLLNPNDLIHIQQPKVSNDDDEINNQENRYEQNTYHNNNNQQGFFGNFYQNLNANQRDNLYKLKVVFFLLFPILMLFFVIFLIQLHLNY